MAERQEINKERGETLRKMLKGEEYDIEIIKRSYTGMSQDILKERKRIGGDWAIAAVTLTRDMRDHIRYPFYWIK